MRLIFTGILQPAGIFYSALPGGSELETSRIFVAATAWNPRDRLQRRCKFSAATQRECESNDVRTSRKTPSNIYCSLRWFIGPNFRRRSKTGLRAKMRTYIRKSLPIYLKALTLNSATMVANRVMAPKRKFTPRRSPTTNPSQTNAMITRAATRRDGRASSLHASPSRGGNDWSAGIR